MCISKLIRPSSHMLKSRGIHETYVQTSHKLKYRQLHLSCTGPAKSTCTLIHGCSGHCHDATGRFDSTCWQCGHCFTSCSMSLSILIHQTNILAKTFILDAPGCPPCNLSRMRDVPCIGINTLLPHKMQSSMTNNSMPVATALEHCQRSLAILP